MAPTASRFELTVIPDPDVPGGVTYMLWWNDSKTAATINHTDGVIYRYEISSMSNRSTEKICMFKTLDEAIAAAIKLCDGDS